MAEYYVLDELRAYLITQGVVQAQSAAASTARPSVWLNPKDGAPLPRTGENATVTLRDTLLTGPPGLEPWLEEAFVDVIVRSRTAPLGKFVQRQIKGLITPRGHLYGRKLWMMNNLLVQYSIMTRGDQDLPTDESGWARVQTFCFAVARSDLST